MRNHKTGCGRCSRKVCCCPRTPVTSSCICPPGPQGPAGPTGPAGSNGFALDPGSIEKWSGLFTVESDGPFSFATSYLADAQAPGTVGGVPVVPGNLLSPPSYPSTPDGIVFDALSVRIKSQSGIAIVFPEGISLVGSLVQNAGQPNELTCLSVTFDTIPGGLVIPASPDGLQGSISGACVIDPGNTYDFRIDASNSGTGGSVNALLGISATARVRSA